MTAEALKKGIEHLKERVKWKLLLRRTEQEWKELKERFLLPGCCSPGKFYLPDAWIENREAGHYKIPANLLDYFNSELTDADRKRAVGYYMKDHYYAVKSFIETSLAVGNPAFQSREDRNSR